MAGAAIGLQAAGAGVSAYSEYKNGLAQQAYYRYLAGNARTEKQLVQEQADQESSSAQNEGANQSKIASRKTSELEGSQISAEAANGISGSVTAANIAKDTFDKAKLDQMAIKYNADTASWRAQQNAKLQKWNLDNEIANDEVAGENAKRAGKVGAITSLLSGATQVANTSANFSKYSSTQKTGRSRVLNNGKPFPVSSGDY